MKEYKMYTLYKANDGKHKFFVILPNGEKDGHMKTKKISFGAVGYSDYTIHKDSDRKDRYVLRHKKDRLDDPYHPGFWAMFVLWNYTSLTKSFKDAVKRAKKILK